MRRISSTLTVVAVLAACCLGVPVRAACPSTDTITDPTEFQWTNEGDHFSGTLEIGEATFVIGGETLTTRAYRQAGGQYSIPGPTMKMVPGNTYVLRFHNTLPYEAPNPDHNIFKDPNISNVHTHGLHISGESPGDDITRSFEGGFGGDFVYDIPADHMGGTYWYHAHHHGSTYLQVAGGAFGLIVVDDGADGIPSNVAAMEESQLLIAFLDPTVAGTGGDSLMSGTLGPTWTVNGLDGGSLCMPQGEWQHWRVLLAHPDARMKTIEVGFECDVALLARDGVWRTSAPRDLATNEITITGASRADLAVRCNADSTIAVDGTQVATVVVDGVGDPVPHPYAADGVSMWSAIRPDYLRDLRGVSQVNNESIRMGARSVNGGKWDADVPTFAVSADTVQEWDINGATQHPFHLHVYHFQAQNCGVDFEDGEYYDTLAAACDIRFDLNTATSTVYDGRTVLHCHILSHEDQGAMTWVDVVGGEGPPTFPAGNYGEYYSICNATEPGTELTCDDGLDNDCDNLIDGADPDCGVADCPQYTSKGACNDDPDCEWQGSPKSGTCVSAAGCTGTEDPEVTCDDGIDNDCDGLTDGADPDCATGACNNDGVCAPGEDCESCAGDCDGMTSGKPANRYCCGNGIAEDPEGDGAICDGNF